MWRDNLEGGLEYLKQVICEDSLGVGVELEADMQRVVDTYECEWKKAIDDPVTLGRFRHFINSDQAMMAWYSSMNAGSRALHSPRN